MMRACGERQPSLGFAASLKNARKTAFMRHQFIMAAGLLLSSRLPPEAQTLATNLFVASETPEAAPMLAPARVTRHPSQVAPAGLLLAAPVPKFTAGFIRRDTPSRNVETVLPVERFRTPDLVESRVVVFQSWGERLQFGGFKSTLHTHNARFGAQGLPVFCLGAPTTRRGGSAVSPHWNRPGVPFGRDERRRHQAPL